MPASIKATTKVTIGSATMYGEAMLENKTIQVSIRGLSTSYYWGGRSKAVVLGVSAEKQEDEQEVIKMHEHKVLTLGGVVDLNTPSYIDDQYTIELTEDEAARITALYILLSDRTGPTLQERVQRILRGVRHAVFGLDSV